MADKKEYSEECKKIVADIMKNVGIDNNELQKKADLPVPTEAAPVSEQQRKADIDEAFMKVESLLQEEKKEPVFPHRNIEFTEEEDDMNRQEQAKGGKKKKKHRALRVLVAILCVVAVVGVAGYFGLDYFFNKLNYVPVESHTTRADGQNALIPVGDNGDPALALTDEEFDSLKELLDQNAKGSEFALADENVWNVLLIGSDTLLEEGVGRSDSMILVTVSKYTDTIVLTSLMRDIFIKIPEYGYDRINAALPWGGVGLLEETISANFGIHVDNYAIVDFQIFQDIINALGGLYLTPTAEEVKAINEAMVNLNHPEYKLEYTNDLTHFNGLQTLYYARIRSIGQSDFDRTERQRKVLLSAKERVLNMDLTEILDLITTYLPRITTDVDSDKCFSLLFSAYNILKNYDISQLRVPLDGTAENATINGMAVLMIDFDENINAWQRLVYGTGTEEEATGIDEVTEEALTQEGTEEGDSAAVLATEENTTVLPTEADPTQEEASFPNDVPTEIPVSVEGTSEGYGGYDDLYGYDYGYDYGYGGGFNRPGGYYY